MAHKDINKKSLIEKLNSEFLFEFLKICKRSGQFYRALEEQVKSIENEIINFNFYYQFYQDLK